MVTLLAGINLSQTHSRPSPCLLLATSSGADHRTPNAVACITTCWAEGFDDLYLFVNSTFTLNADRLSGFKPIAARVRYGLTRSTSGIGLSGAAVAISRLKRSVVPSNIHPPSLQCDPVSIDFPSRSKSAFAVASRSAR